MSLYGAHEWFFSKIINTWWRAFNYTPPGYDILPQQHYPVFILRHGDGEDEKGGVENIISSSYSIFRWNEEVVDDVGDDGKRDLVLVGRSSDSTSFALVAFSQN
jgi:hypothetical protein